MTDCEKILLEYYRRDSRLYEILLTHSRLVARKAISVLDKHPEIEADRDFVYEAAMLHDIGIFKCDAPDIDCFGKYPYICHGYLGADLLREQGLPRHALVAERHTGTGLPAAYIKEKDLPLPSGRIYEPQSIEEKIVCYADKFYSKTRPGTEKTIDNVCKSLAKKSEDSVKRFLQWNEVFG